MLHDYKPTPQQIVEALKVLGWEEDFNTLDRDGAPTEADYPDLVGVLLAVAEATKANVIKATDDEANDAVIEAYWGAFVPNADEEEISHEVMFQEYLIAMIETAKRQHALSEVPPFADHGEMDHPLANVAALSAMISCQATHLRLGLALALLESEDGDTVEEVRGLIAAVPRLVSESARLTAMLASLIDPTEHPHHHQHDDVELCDEHRQEMEEVLEGIEEASLLTEEQRQNNDEIEILRAAGGKIWERWLAAVQEANAQRDEHGWTEETIAASSTWLAEKRHALLAELDQKDN